MPAVERAVQLGRTIKKQPRRQLHKLCVAQKAKKNDEGCKLWSDPYPAFSPRRPACFATSGACLSCVRILAGGVARRSELLRAKLVKASAWSVSRRSIIARFLKVSPRAASKDCHQFFSLFVCTLQQGIDHHRSTSSSKLWVIVSLSVASG